MRKMYESAGIPRFKPTFVGTQMRAYGTLTSQSLVTLYAHAELI